VHEFCRNWNIFDDLKYEILDFFLSSKGVFLENSNMKSVMHSLPHDYQCIVAPYLAKDCISRTALFKGSNPEFLSLLLESLSLESFSAGELLFELGDVPHSLYIVKSGTCVLVNENNAVVAELSDSDIIGEVSCFRSRPRAYTCVCLKFCELYVLSAPKLARLFKLFPDFKKSFSNYCRTKILMELSVKRQFSALFANQSRATRVLSPSRPSAPNSPSQSPLLLPMSAKKLAPLEPLPKGKYVPPRAPEVRHMLLQRTLKLSHGERVRLFAEIQVGAFRRLRSHAIFPFKIPAPGLYF
jgi:CRP-like cAMP-binding protein